MQAVGVQSGAFAVANQNLKENTAETDNNTASTDKNTKSTKDNTSEVQKKAQALAEAIKYAAKFDRKILIEEGINAREVECAVLGNENIEVANVGEIIPAGEFYSFDSKYQNAESVVQIPANISKEKAEEIMKMAKKAYRAIDAKGLARVDFFIEKDTGKVYLNEINTMPGFTKISMYPQLWDSVGVKYNELLDWFYKWLTYISYDEDILKEKISTYDNKLNLNTAVHDIIKRFE